MTKVFENIGKLGNCTTTKTKIIFIDWNKRIKNEPTVSPFAQAHAMKCMGARHSYETCDRRVHALQTDWTSGKFV